VVPVAGGMTTALIVWVRTLEVEVALAASPL
jgi:hypothetical protein